MNSLWNDNEIQTDDPLQRRVYTSRLLGSNPSLVLHGGGNTSVKTIVTDVLGDEIEVLYVKGSGWDLATIEAEGFAPVRLDVLLRLAQLETLSDSDMVRSQRAAMLNPNAPNPSVETILHALIPFQYVDHTHADAVVTITNTPNGEERIREIYGSNMLIVPYVMPGFILAKTIYEMTRDIDWNTLDEMILLNHGVFTFANSARASYERMIEIVTQAEDYLALKIGNGKRKIENEEALEWTSEDLLQVVRLRQAVTRLRGSAVLAQWDRSAESVAFSSQSNYADLSTRGLLTPDHVIRNKRIPLVLDDKLDSALAGFASDYEAYFDEFAPQSDQPLTMLDPAPRWAVWHKRGTISLGRNLKECRITTDIKRHTLRAITKAEAFDQWHTLPAHHIFDIEYWELEQAKLRRGGSAPPFQGKIVLVTGAASGIGRSCAETFAVQGAVVAALDIAPATYGSKSILGIECDLTDADAVQKAVELTVATYGGLDIVVSNAGTFPASATIEALDGDQWQRSLDINLTAHQRLWQACVPFLRHGIDPSIVVIASKNVPAPGPGASAYSVAKAGLTQLARVAALELGKDGIRVNMLHPDAVFDTALWTDEVLSARAKHYDMTVEAYKRKNVLGTEIVSADVAHLVCTIAGSAFSKTTGAQIPIDGGNLRVI